jgi:uncharacterized protein DUF6364
MKAKLTLTVEESIIAEAKRYSKRAGKSLSGMFEELFLNAKKTQPKSERAFAAARLMKLLDESKPVKTLDDKKLRKEHLLKKYA